MSLRFYLFLIFFLVGFSPLFYYAIAIKPEIGYSRFVGFFHNAFNLQEISLVHTASKARDLLTKDLLRLFDFEHLPSLLGYLYYALFSVCFIYLLWINRYSIRRLLIPLKLKKMGPLSRESIFLLFLSTFSLIYILSTYTVWPGWQNAGYIVPLYPFMFAVIAVGAQRLIHTKYKLLKGLLIAVLGFILLAGFYENITLILFKKIGQGFTYKGYSYRIFGERIGASNFHYGKVIEKIKKFDFSKRKYFLQGFGWGIARTCNSDKAMVVRGEEFLKKFSFGKEDRLHFFKGLGRGISHHMALYMYHKSGIVDESDINVKSYLSVLKSIIDNDEEVRRYFWKGFGQGADFPHADKLLGNYVEERFKMYFYEGLGENIARQNLEGTRFDFVKDLDPRYVEAIYSGYKERYVETLIKDNGYDD